MPSKQYYHKHKEYLIESHRQWCESNKERLKEYQSAYMRNWLTDSNNRKKINAIVNKHQKNLRIRIFDVLGHICNNVNCLVVGRCNDIRCLEIDHIKGGGNKEAREFGGRSNMYRWYLKHPDEIKKRLQILCSNCNAIKIHQNKELDINTLPL